MRYVLISGRHVRWEKSENEEGTDTSHHVFYEPGDFISDLSKSELRSLSDRVKLVADAPTPRPGKKAEPVDDWAFLANQNPQEALEIVVSLDSIPTLESARVSELNNANREKIVQAIDDRIDQLEKSKSKIGE